MVSLHAGGGSVRSQRATAVTAAAVTADHPAQLLQLQLVTRQLLQPGSTRTGARRYLQGQRGCIGRHTRLVPLLAFLNGTGRAGLSPGASGAKGTDTLFALLSLLAWVAWQTLHAPASESDSAQTG